MGDQVLHHRERIEKETQGMRAPGLLESHYAPKKRLIVLPAAIEKMMSKPNLPLQGVKRVACLSFFGNPKTLSETLSEILELPVEVRTLSEKQDWCEAGKNFFQTLRALDASEGEVLLSEPISTNEIESNGIAYAIADRLRRASAPKK